MAAGSDATHYFNFGNSNDVNLILTSANASITESDRSNLANDLPNPTPEELVNEFYSKGNIYYGLTHLRFSCADISNVSEDKATLYRDINNLLHTMESGEVTAFQVESSAMGNSGTLCKSMLLGLVDGFLQTSVCVDLIPDSNQQTDYLNLLQGLAMPILDASEQQISGDSEIATFSFWVLYLANELKTLGIDSSGYHAKIKEWMDMSSSGALTYLASVLPGPERDWRKGAAGIVGVVKLALGPGGPFTNADWGPAKINELLEYLNSNPTYDSSGGTQYVNLDLLRVSRQFYKLFWNKPLPVTDKSNIDNISFFDMFFSSALSRNATQPLKREKPHGLHFNTGNINSLTPPNGAPKILLMSKNVLPGIPSVFIEDKCSVSMLNYKYNSVSLLNNYTVLNKIRIILDSKMTSIIAENPEIDDCKYIVSEVPDTSEEPVPYYLYVTIFTAKPLNDPTKGLIKLNVGDVDPVVDSIKEELPTGATTSKNSNLVSVTKDYLGKTLSSTNEEIFTAIKSKVPSTTNVVAS